MDVSEGKPCTAPPHASRRPVRVTQKGRRRRKKKKKYEATQTSADHVVLRKPPADRRPYCPRA